jgi:molybdate transport system substrate-binding protein
MSARWRAVAAVSACVLGLAACTGASGDAPVGEDEVLTDPAGGPGPTGTLTVFAAASLTDVFTDLAERLEEDNPSLDVQISFAGSSALAGQLEQGAPADVFASADQPNMARLLAAGNEGGPPEVFATNALAIIVELGNPVGIDGLGDLEDPDVVVVTGDPSTPIGAYAAAVFDNAEVTVEPDSFEEDAKAVVNKVVLGEADAGLVYATDALAAGEDVDTVEIPANLNVVNAYYIAAVKRSPAGEAAADWISLVTSRAGQDVFEAAGFGPP